MPSLPDLIRSWSRSPDERCRKSEDALSITVEACGAPRQLLVVPIGSGDNKDWTVVEENLPYAVWALREDPEAEVAELLEGHLHSLKEESEE